MSYNSEAAEFEINRLQESNATLRAQLAAATQRIAEAKKGEQTMIDDATIKRVAEGLCDVRKVPTQGKSGVRNRKDYAFSSRRLREFARAIEQLARQQQRDSWMESNARRTEQLDEANRRIEFVDSYFALAQARKDAVPDALYMPDKNWKGDVDEATYKAGWNDCRAAMLAAAPAPQSLNVKESQS